MSRPQAFWDRIAPKYAAQAVSDPAAYEEKLARTRALLTPDMDLLEFGCGTGTTALIHAPKVSSVLGIDYSEKMIGIARGKAEAQGIANVEFRIDAIETLDVPPESFDIVLGMSILHLVHEPEAVIAKVHSLLRPGGYFVSSTTCIGTMPLIFRWILPIGGRLGFIPHLSVFSADKLVENIASAGFAITDRWQPKPGAALFVIAQKPKA